MIANFRFVVAAGLLLAAATVQAHDFECERTVALVAAGPDGTPAVGQSGTLPTLLGTPAPVLTLSSYPALVGFETTLRNVATDPSVVVSVSAPTLDPLGSRVTTFGTSIVPGLTLPVAGAVTEVRTVLVASQEECLALFAGGQLDGPTCSADRDDRLVVTHDVGSTECRARVVCAPPAAPPPGCGDLWHGVKLYGQFGGGAGIALDGACALDVVGSEHGIDEYLMRLDASGTDTQHVTISSSPSESVSGVAVDAAGNRWVAWTDTTQSVVHRAHLSRFAPDGTRTFDDSVAGGDIPFEPPASTFAGGVAVDAAGNAYLVGWTNAATVTPATPAPPVPGFASAGGVGIFAMKIDAATGTRAWAVQFGTTRGGDAATGAAVDAAANLFVAGRTPGAMPGNTSTDSVDAFVAEIGPDGTLTRVAQLGTSGYDSAEAVAVDAAGDVYVAGLTSGGLGGNAPPSSTSAAFLAKLGPDLAVAWVRQVELADLLTRASGVAVDTAGDAWIAGTTVSTQHTAYDEYMRDAFVARYGPDGTPSWTTRFGTPAGALTDGRAIAIDAQGNSFVTGSGAEVSKIPSTFVAKLDPSGTVK